MLLRVCPNYNFCIFIVLNVYFSDRLNRLPSCSVDLISLLAIIESSYTLIEVQDTGSFTLRETTQSDSNICFKCY